MPEKDPFVNQALARARILEKRRQFEQAAKIYKSILEQFPSNKLAKKRLRLVSKAMSGKLAPRAERPVSRNMAPASSVKDLIGIINEGRLQEALSRGTALTGQFPHDAGVFNILGVVNARMGRTEAALACYDKALMIQPDSAEVHNNRGNMLNRLHRHTDAANSFRQAIQINPAYGEAHNNLGSALFDAGETDQAVACFQRALEINPSHVEAHNNLGNGLASLGRYEVALTSFARALKLNPGFSPSHFNRGNTLKSMGRLDEATAAYSKATQIDPAYAEAFNGLGNALNEQGRHQQAVDALGKAIRLRQGFVEAHCNLGNALSDLNQHDKAIQSYLEALKIDPGFAQAHCNLGNVYYDLGRYDDAACSYENALEFNSGFAAVYNNLSQIRTFSKDDGLIGQMLQQFSKPGTTEDEKMHLGFALGKANDDLGNVDEAFSYFQRANQLKKSILDYDICQDQARFRQIKALFTFFSQSTGIEPAIQQEPGVTPILVVGMPRSGTSLVEQILASHPQVFGAGELEVLNRTLGPVLNQDTAQLQNETCNEVLLDLGNIYRDELNHLQRPETFITDKMPGNFRWLGFIKKALPDVKIIHLQRDPVATCWSIFRHHFGSHGNGYAYDLEDIAAYYELYLDLMDFWRQMMPGQIYDLDYEALTQNQETGTRNLLDFCGLCWDDQCLEFHTTRRNVKTLSSKQVRKPMYTGSSEVWRQYKDHLQPLIQALSH
jgi:tetratricopeptide (TPR) repeat protein